MYVNIVFHLVFFQSIYALFDLLVESESHQPQLTKSQEKLFLHANISTFIKHDLIDITIPSVRRNISKTFIGGTLFNYTLEYSIFHAVVNGLGQKTTIYHIPPEERYHYLCVFFKLTSLLINNPSYFTYEKYFFNIISSFITDLSIFQISPAEFSQKFHTIKLNITNELPFICKSIGKAFNETKVTFPPQIVSIGLNRMDFTKNVFWKSTILSLIQNVLPSFDSIFNHNGTKHGTWKELTKSLNKLFSPFQFNDGMKIDHKSICDWYVIAANGKTNYKRILYGIVGRHYETYDQPPFPYNDEKAKILMDNLILSNEQRDIRIKLLGLYGNHHIPSN
ncbi:hypothetical protein SNEBB_002640 [Seison nebaliae]|nr:hypothetical protein SNEBB_002640 [Seison nebaliae]